MAAIVTAVIIGVSVLGTGSLIRVGVRGDRANFHSRLLDDTAANVVCGR